jgi:hypothetical protein
MFDKIGENHPALTVHEIIQDRNSWAVRPIGLPETVTVQGRRQLDLVMDKRRRPSPGRTADQRAGARDLLDVRRF